MSNIQQVDNSSIASLFKGLNVQPMDTETVTESTETKGVEFSSAVTPDDKLLQSGVAKINTMETELSNKFKERESIIKMCLAALVTRQPVLMLGPHGCAKSALINDICDRITGANYFSWLLNKTTDPSEILGPFSIKEMENDRFVRITKGKLPEAEISFLDEVYKSNAPTLNALLTLMNEKVFFNDGQAQDVPLITLFGASNEPPEEESLAPLHDRFIFRVNVEYVKDQKNIQSMCSDFISRKAGTNNMTNKTKISLQELEAMQKAADNVMVPKTVLNEYLKLLNKLSRGVKLTVSDRRKNECLRILQASAVIHGRSIANYDDFELLPFALWEENSQIGGIQDEVSKIKSPLEDELAKAKATFKKIKDNIEGTSNPDEKLKRTLANKQGVTILTSNLNSIIISNKGKNNKFTKEFEDLRDEVVNYANNEMANQMNNSFL